MRWMEEVKVPRYVNTREGRPAGDAKATQGILPGLKNTDVGVFQRLQLK
jgi:hypothetical protein